MDASFLALEDANAHMHMGSVTLFEAGSLAGSDGGLDFERIVDFAHAQLHKTPRFRQKLAWVPRFEQPSGSTTTTSTWSTTCATLRCRGPETSAS